METFLLILGITLAVAVVALLAFFMIKITEEQKKQNNEILMLVKTFFVNEENKRKESFKIENVKITIPLRIQAYERLVLLLERINPESLLLRLQSPQMTAGLLHQELLITIRAEFEHNLSQQIYVSQSSWDAVKIAKDTLVRTINEAAERIAPVAPATALSETILSIMMTQQNNQIQNALYLLKRDAENYM